MRSAHLTRPAHLTRLLEFQRSVHLTRPVELSERLLYWENAKLLGPKWTLFHFALVYGPKKCVAGKCINGQISTNLKKVADERTRTNANGHEFFQRLPHKSPAGKN